jgi:AraC-like DNA-binding protein
MHYRGNQAMEKFENRFNSMRSITALFGTNSSFLPSSMLTGPGTKQKGIQILRDTAAYNTNIYVASVYYGGDDFYTSGGFVRPHVYFTNTLNCSAKAVALGLSVIDMEENAVVYLGASNGAYLLFHFPVPSSGPSGKWYFNYIINRDDFLDIFQPLLELNNVIITISFPNVESTPDLYLEGNLENGLRVISEEKQKDGNPEEYKIMFAASSELSGINLKVSYIENNIYMETNQLWMISTVSLILIMLVVVSVAFILSLFYYRKINNVKTSLEKAWNGDITERPVNEFDYINSIINRLVQKNDQMTFNSLEMKQDMKQQAMKLLIHGVIKDENTARGILETYSLNFPEPYYTLVGLLYNQRKKGSKELLKKAFEDRLYCETEAGEPPALIVMFGLSDNDFKKTGRYKISEELKKIFQGISPSDIKIGFSRAYENITMMSHAYVEALGAAENPSIGGRGLQIGYFDAMISPHNYTVQFSENDILEFDNSLQKRDFNAVCAAFDKLKHDIVMPQISDGNQKYLRYLVLQTIIMSVRNMKENGELIKDIIGINPDDGARFDASMIAVFRRICPSSKDNNFDKVLAFINENYSRQGLSLDEVASYMGFSLSYMSRLFKEKTGYRYIDYLTELRLDRAKQLLSTTDLPIKAVSEMVGYNNVAGFRNKFKEKFGVSAAAFRRSPD